MTSKIVKSAMSEDAWLCKAHGNFNGQMTSEELVAKKKVVRVCAASGGFQTLGCHLTTKIL